MPGLTSIGAQPSPQSSSLISRHLGKIEILYGQTDFVNIYHLFVYGIGYDKQLTEN